MTAPSERRKLADFAHTFASELQDVLNKTVCNGASVTADVRRRGDDIIVVGTRLDKEYAAQPVALCLDRKKPRCWFEAQFRCDLDDRGFLRVLTSYFAISAHEGMTSLCHYDYERNKEGYPAAHVQVEGMSAALGELPGSRMANELHKLHFPVGGRRYRPTVEDRVRGDRRVRAGASRLGADRPGAPREVP